MASDHPLRRIREMAATALQRMGLHFAALYARRGRPSIAPEKLIRALLLQILYSIRSERQLVEQLNYNILFRWFVGLSLDDAVWDATVYTKNRQRLMQGEIAQRLMEAVVEQAQAANLLSEEHFTVDGTLIQAWANRRSFQAKAPATVEGTGARGRKLLRDTHQSTTDAEARLYSKGGAASIPCYLGHVVIENQNGLVVGACASQFSKTAEAEAALQMLDERKARGKLRGTKAERAITVGADRAYQTEFFILGLRQRNVVPHVAEYVPNPHFPNFLTEQERRHPGFAISQRKRKLVEKVFGWGKQGRAVKQIKLRGRKRVDWMFRLLMTAHNLIRMVRLVQPVPAQ